MEKANHQVNDLKNMTDSGLEVLLNLNRSKNGAEYYQKCSLCQKILPDQIAMYHHGQQEHANQGFSFTNVHPLMFRCLYCLFSSQEEMVLLRHIISHFGGFHRCHFCQMDQPGGFEQYIQHCYTKHHERVGRFRQVYTYRVILRFLMQTALQFQNGLIISKNSLLNTRYNSDTLSRQLYEELMALAERPPIPRIHIGLKNRTPIAIQGIQGEPVPKKAKISQRRQTLGPDGLIRTNPPAAAAAAAVAPSPAAALSPSPAAAHGSRPANTIWSTSFTGTNPTAPLQPPPPAAAKLVAGNQQTTSTAGPQNIIRNLKRRNSVVIFSRP
ncbi:GL26751 [Drosophila persimilis]|uniref:GL26751 n=2 Tax=Drosophila persimilis TaxID=7234 RepID=B4H2Q0_DROPE|nr:GL26751 [Drosophila persimilis]